MTLDVSSVLILGNWNFPLGRAGYGHVVQFDQCDSLVPFHTLVPKTPVLAVEKQVVSLVFLHVLSLSTSAFALL